MEIVLYSEFSKRKNSTKNPESAGAISVSVTKDVKLKGECDLLRPSFFVSGTTGFVYAKAWGWYYFVTNTSYDINGAQYIDCEIDVLGTWASIIKNTTAMVRFSSSNYDENVIDDRVAQKVTNQYETELEESIFVGSGAGCYVISTVNNDPAYGGVTTYAIEEAELRALGNDLLNDGNAWASLEQIFADVSSGILSCRYVPVPISEFYSTGANYIRIGDWIDANIQGEITDGMITDFKELTIPWRYSDFRRNGQYTRFILGLPFIGYVDISPEKLIGHSKIQIHMVGNAVTGNIIYGVKVDGREVASYSGSFGRTVPISTSQKDMEGFLSGLSTQGGAVLGGAVGSTALGLGLASTPAGEFALMAGMVKSAYSLMQGVLQSTCALHKSDFTHMGGFGGGFGEEIISGYSITAITFDSQTEPDELRELYGRPCYKVLSLATLTGYVQTIGFSIDISAPDSIKVAINEAMDNGVYLE